MYEDRAVFACRLADAASDAIMRAFRRPVEVTDKSDSTPVTAADKNAEKAMREMIEREFPRDGVVGEEYGAENAESEYVWVLDPIDGTQSFIAGVPLFGTLVALMHRGEPVVGVINQPFTKERWVGVAGRQTTLNGRPVQTRKCASLDRAVLFSTADKTMFANADDKKRFDTLRDRVKSARYSTDCYGYGLVAAGCGDIVCEADLKLYDYAALLPVVRGAGGEMTDWTGRALSPENDGGGRILAVGDARLIAQTAEVLNL